MNQYGQDRRIKDDEDNKIDVNMNENSTIGKRQKFLNLVKNTKDVYIPSLTSSISQRTADSFKRSTTDPLLNIPTDMDILFYPTYSTKVGDQYETTLRFTVCSPGNPASRKNRILFSLCKQLVKPVQFNAADEDIMEDKFDETLANTDSTSTLSSRSTSGSLSTQDVHLASQPHSASNELDVLKTRTLGFFSRSITNMPIIIDLLADSGSGRYETISATTDDRGYLHTHILTNFLPTAVRITLDTPVDFPKVITHQYSCEFVKPDGFGVISDIDDTIKHTGVTGDKRSMFRNVFINDIETWLIRDIASWYNTLRRNFDVDFFYVSNSPMQIYPLLQQYITKHFPSGPLFLKQYSGNLLSSIMTSSANRKLLAIGQVLNDFPTKKFILVGDSGEKDFEAYLTTAMQYPEQIIAIYIRCCKNSMSDMGLREDEVMRELNEMINDSYLNSLAFEADAKAATDQKVTYSRSSSSPPPVPPKKAKLTFEQEKLIRDSRPPPIPKKKPRLSPEQEAMIQESHSSIDKAPNSPPPLPSRRPTEESDPMVYYTPSTQNDYGAYSSFFDKRADNWRNRVANGIKRLNQLSKDRKIRLMFFMNPETPMKDSITEIQQK